jgi:hypothetical protein
MNRVKCPRCLQDWYNDDDPLAGAKGSDSLCSGCLADLRAAGHDPEKRYGRGYIRKHREPVRLNVFVIFVLVLAGIDFILIGLTMIFPQPCGFVCALYGLILSSVGGSIFRWMTWGSWYHRDIDWNLAKWPAMVAVAGIVCVVASARMLLP